MKLDSATQQQLKEVESSINTARLAIGNHNLKAELLKHEIPNLSNKGNEIIGKFCLDNGKKPEDIINLTDKEITFKEEEIKEENTEA